MAALDERWIDAVATYTETEVDFFNDLVFITAENGARFLEGKDDQPQMTPLEVAERVDIEERRARWQLLADEIAKHEDNPWVQDLYQKKIARQLTRLDIMGTAYTQDFDSFLKHTHILYGDTKPTMVCYLAERLRKIVATAPSDIAEEAEEYFEDFLGLCPAGSQISAEILPMPISSAATVDTSEAVYEIFSDYLKKTGIEDWEVLIDTTGSKRVFSVALNRQRIYIPATKYLQSRRHRLTSIGVEAIAAHEIGVHAMRVRNGNRSPLRLLAYGLHDYLRGEEGAATYVQQTVEGAKEYYGFDRYLAIALAKGVDGTPRAFREVFEGMYYYYLLTYDETEVREKDPSQYASNAAFIVTQRIFRGTTGREPGVCYTRDLAYMEGNIGMWELLTKKPHLSQYLTLGKYDMLNSEHTEALMALGIINDM